MCSFWPFWPDTNPVQPAGPQQGPYLGLPNRLTELLAGVLPVTPRATTTPNPCPMWAVLAGVTRERTWGVVWCGVVWCGVVWCGVVWALLPSGSGRDVLHTENCKTGGLCV